jgi:hypothetical protein
MSENERIDGQQIKTLGQAAKVFFTRPSIRTIAAKAGAAWLDRARMGRPRLSDAAITGAVVAWWPFQEWLAHKHILHMEPRPGKNGPADVYAAYHRAHHEDPRDIDLTFVPDEVVAQAQPMTRPIFYVLTGFDKRRAATADAAYSSMTLLYEWVHFLVHTGVKPNTKRPIGRLYARIRRNHRYHHYLHEDYWYSFVWPDVDKWLGTEPDPKSIEPSPTVKNLHGANVSGEDAAAAASEKAA